MSDPLATLPGAPGAPYVRAMQLVETIVVRKGEGQNAEPDLAMKAVLHGICRFVGSEYKTWVSQPTLAKYIGCSERTLRDHIRRLEKCGYVSIDRVGKTNGEGGRSPNVMTVAVERLLESLRDGDTALPSGMVLEWLKDEAGVIVDLPAGSAGKSDACCPAEERRRSELPADPPPNLPARFVELPAGSAGHLPAGSAGEELKEFKSFKKGLGEERSLTFAVPVVEVSSEGASSKGASVTFARNLEAPASGRIVRRWAEGATGLALGCSVG